MQLKASGLRPEASSLSKKSSNGWAFSYLDGIINMGDERCWNAEKWIAES